MSVSASLPTMSEEFRAGCEQFGITDEVLEFALKRSDLSPRELLSIDTTTSARNFRVAYLNKAGERKWTHLFMVGNPTGA
ncbi:MAG: hypothetical protein OEY97_09820 [Nitrospirota bacterium]|nr:hypothetical protein [Nitrospirota bacterium]